MSEKPPSVFDHVDHVAYLEAWYAWKRSQNASYSLGVFALKAGLGHSTFHNVLRRRRFPTAETVDGFARACSWTAEERSFFVDLVEIARAPTVALRLEALERAFENPRCSIAQRLGGPYLKAVSTWYHAAIRDLASVAPFPNDGAAVAARLDHRITEEQATEALDTLCKAGLLVEQQDGLLATGTVRVATDEDARGAVTYAFHLSLLENAEDALSRVPPTERYFGASTFTLTESALQKARHEVFRFVKEMADLADLSDGTEPERLVQLSVQLFPLTVAEDRSDPGDEEV